MVKMWLVVVTLILSRFVFCHTAARTLEEASHETPDPPLTDLSWNITSNDTSQDDVSHSEELAHVSTINSQDVLTDKRGSPGGNTHGKGEKSASNDLVKYFRDLLGDINVAILALPEPEREYKQNIQDDFFTSIEETQTVLAHSDESLDSNQDYPEFDTNITYRSTGSNNVSAINRTQSRNLTLDIETNTESELVDLFWSKSEEVASTDPPVGTEGHSWLSEENTTLEPPGPRLPLCCLNGQDKDSCRKKIHQAFSFYIPVAFGRCRAPEPHLFQQCLAKYIDCPPQELRQVAFTQTRKIVYTDKLYFSWDQVLIDDFCVEVGSENNSVAKAVFCHNPPSATVARPCRGPACLKKCCPEGYVLKNHSCICLETTSSLSVTFNKILDVGWPSVTENIQTEIQVGFPYCQNAEAITTYSVSSTQRNIHFHANGSLVVEQQKPSFNYCVDEILGEENTGSLEERIIVTVCAVPTHDKQSTWRLVRSVLIPAGLVVSCVFLAATLLCHLCVAPLRDLHGLCLAAYVAALLVADATLFVTQAFSRFLPPSACVSVAVILHLAFLSSFFWLNVICYDVWKYVGLTVQAVPLYRYPDDFGRFFAYAVYAWGSPLIIGGVAVVIHSLPQHIDWLLKPDFVKNRCWFRDGKEILAYFYGPMGVLCMANTLLICHTGLRLYCADKKCDCFFGSCRRADHTLYRTHMTEFWQRFTLFALMVICWVMEVISWMVGPADSELWALTDTLNTFQGVFIFITFLRSSKKRRLLQQTLTQWSAGSRGPGADRTTHLPQPHLPASISTRVANRIRSLAIIRWFLRISRRPHLSSQQVLDNIIFKRKMEAPQGFKNKAYEDDANDVDSDAKRSVCGEEPLFKSFNPIWTVPHWKSHYSKTYFPNVLSTSNQTGNHPCREEFKCDDYKDLINLCSSFDHALPYMPLEPRPSFTNWSILRHKTGSLTLATGEEGQVTHEVVCHGLTKTES